MKTRPISQSNYPATAASAAPRELAIEDPARDRGSILIAANWGRTLEIERPRHTCTFEASTSEPGRAAWRRCARSKQLFDALKRLARS